jgi:phospholipid-binding lipoprotein MlaA
MLSLAACASKHDDAGAAPAATTEDNNDPYESVNRKIWDFDMTLDRYLLKPIAQGYKYAMPDLAQTAIANILRNLNNPVILANDLLQGNGKRAGITFKRLAINTIIGLGGMIDIAAKNNIPYHYSDFGQTLGVWGVQSGPFIVLPLLGPSDPRDAVGYGADSVADPFTIKMNAARIAEGNYVRAGVGIISSRAQSLNDLDELKRSSLDFYAAVRSLYQQQRAAAVREGQNPDGTQAPGIQYDEEPVGPVPSKAPGPTPSAPAAPGSGPAAAKSGKAS